VRVEPITISPERISELEANLLLVYTGMSRLASEIAGGVISNMENRKKTLYQMRGMVEKAMAILNNQGPLDDFGRLLHENWLLKRGLSENVSNGKVDKIYKLALDQGALGGKLLGAGHSGFMVFYVPPEKRHLVSEALADYLQVQFKFENEGSKIIFYKPEPLLATKEGFPVMTHNINDSPRPALPLAN
jgi:D-glycero-alpha-D-manno-heptose-7-phosphate kinase